MNLVELAIKRPIFIVCLFILILGVGYLSLKNMAVDLYPDVTVPVVTIFTSYPGAGPEEVEQLVSKPIEDEISSIAGIKKISSINQENNSVVIAEFTLESDLKYAEQQIRDKVASARRKMPNDVEETIVRSVDLSDQPIMFIAVTADLPPAQLYDLAQEQIRPKIQQVNQVGLVEVLGGRRREILVELDQKKLKEYEISASTVAERIALAGENIPSGTITRGENLLTYRTLAEFRNLEDIGSVILRFFSNERPVRVRDVAEVKEALEEERSRVFVNNEPSLVIQVYRQSGANTVQVVDAVYKKIEQLNHEYSKSDSGIKLQVSRDNARYIRANIYDVKETIFIGCTLVILVVLLFLGNFRSTIITGLALPNSLLGAFIFMSLFGFSINVMTLLALVLVVGLLIDDAIVVRENIFRHIEMGKNPREAAIVGTKEVLLAVIATTLTVVAVFGPIGFLEGVVGQFFKEFGLTICIAMLISLFDAVTMAPMLSAYFASRPKNEKRGIYYYSLGAVLRAFDRFQSYLEDQYERILKFTIRKPWVVLGSALGIFILSLYVTTFIPKTFLPETEAGEFMLSLELPPESSLDRTAEVAEEIDRRIRSNPEIEQVVRIVGSRNGETNKSFMFVRLVPFENRQASTSQIKDRVREQLKAFSFANPIVTDINAAGGGGGRVFSLLISGNDLLQLEAVSQQVFERLKAHPGLVDPEISHRPGKPEIQFVMNPEKAESLGVSTRKAGFELRTLVEGSTPAVFREDGLEYNVRVRLREDQRNLKENFKDTLVPNINDRLIPVTAIADIRETAGPAEINRQDRNRYISIGADLAPEGGGMASVIQDVENLFKSEIQLPPGVSYSFSGQVEDFNELNRNIMLAVLLGVLFIYLVLSSLYESFITPFTIMLVLPLALCGAFFGLWIGGKSLDIFSMIGCVLLLGVATKNSILLVDYANQLLPKGYSRTEAILKSGRVRLRPILMTSFALIAGMIPIAIGLNEASRQRTSMGVAILGGLISSTFLTLVVIPAAYAYLDRFRAFVETKFSKLTTAAEVRAASGEEQTNLPEQLEESWKEQKEEVRHLV